MTDATMELANVHVHIEPYVKEQAEDIFHTLGIPTATAINLFYQQVIEHQGLPFNDDTQHRKPLDASLMTDEELHNALEEGYQNYLHGKSISSDKFFQEFYEKYAS